MAVAIVAIVVLNMSGETSTSDDTMPAPDPTTSEPSAGGTATTTRPPESTTTSAEGLPESEVPGAGEAADLPVPIGQAVTLDRWHIGVVEVELDATETILAHVDYNEDPQPGHQYLIVQVNGVNLGDSHAEPVLGFALVKEGFSNTPGDQVCGLVPDSVFDIRPVAPGNEFTGNVCFEIATADITEDLLFTLGLLDDSGQERFFAIR